MPLKLRRQDRRDQDQLWSTVGSHKCGHDTPRETVRRTVVKRYKIPLKELGLSMGSFARIPRGAGELGTLEVLQSFSVQYMAVQCSGVQC